MKYILSIICFVLIFSCDRKEQQRVLVDPVSKYWEVDSVFNSFELVPYSELPKEFIEQCNLNKEFSSFYEGTSWYKVDKNDLNKVVVGHFRLSELVPKDDQFYRCCMGKGCTYVLLDRKIVYKLLDLLQIMKEKGLNTAELSIYHGFRHPAYNDEVGGASRSQHLFGRAIDIRPGDVDGDGDIDKQDKKAVVDILDQEVIGDEGGIGDYHHSMGIHMDVRGYRARWDRQ